MTRVAMLLALAGCQRGPTFDLQLDAEENPPAGELATGVAHEVILHRESVQRDVLWVVADCRSMLTEHLRLWQDADEIVSPFLESPDDWHMGVLRAWAPFARSPFEPEGALVLAGDVRYLSPNTVAPVQRFQDMMKGERGLAGTGAGGNAWAFDALYKAMTPPRLDEDNEGFFRPDAELDIIMVSDVDENSPTTSVDDMVALFRAFKPRPDMVRVHSVVVPETKDCDVDDGQRFRRLTDAVGGDVASVCELAWTDIVDDIARKLKYAAQWYYLADLPVPSTLQVQVTTEDVIFDGQLLGEDGSPAEPCNTVCATYRYDAAINAIRFTNFAPPPGAKVDVKYKRLRDVGGNLDTDP